VARRRGQSTLELALTLPLLMLLVLGIVDFSRVFIAANTLAQASREGARWGSLNWNDQTGICSKVTTSASAAGVSVPAADISISYIDGTDGTTVFATAPGCGAYVAKSPCTRAATCANPIPGDLVRVDIALPWSAQTSIIQAVLPSNFNIVATTATAIEQ
jgi:Flp pilus assembly protein TadG